MSEKPKYVGRGGSRGGGRPKTFRKTYTFTLTDEVKQMLDQIAIRNGMSKSDLIEKMIRLHHDS